jgi:hypothetical protein
MNVRLPKVPEGNSPALERNAVSDISWYKTRALTGLEDVAGPGRGDSS